MEKIAFTDLNINKPIAQALEEKGFTYATRIQALAYAPVMSGRDLIGLAQTGTGKTLAYLLPLLRLWKFNKKQEPTFMVVVPTRELVQQVVKSAEEFSAFMNFKTLGVYGGANINTQKQQIAEGCDLIVGTPGRLMDLCLTGVLKAKNIQKLVLDEVDELLDQGFRTQLNNLFDILPEKRQNLMFSATLSEEVEELIQHHFRNPLKIEAASPGTPVEKIEQQVLACANFYSKRNFLEHFMDQLPAGEKALVFTDSKQLADLLIESLEESRQEKTGVIHSNKSQNYRFRVLNEFDQGKITTLIATDMVSRGIDLENLDWVINFDLPNSLDQYIHRIGRTGRAGAKGKALSLVNDEQAPIFTEWMQNIKQSFETLEWPEEVEISEEAIDQEKDIKLGVDVERSIRPQPKVNPAAFHEKKAKNQKVNLGGSYKRKIKAKYKKPKTRGQKKK